MEKRKWMAITVTTTEALTASIEEKCRLFCVDDPLYREIRDTMHTVPGADHYEITCYDDLGLAMFKRVRGDRCFDDAHFQPYYTALFLSEHQDGNVIIHPLLIDNM